MLEEPLLHDYAITAPAAPCGRHLATSTVFDALRPSYDDDQHSQRLAA